MSAQATRFSSLWRRAGLNYVQHINIATNALRNTLKEPARSEAFGRSSYAYRQVVFQDGKELAPGKFISGENIRFNSQERSFMSFETTERYNSETQGAVKEED